VIGLMIDDNVLHYLRRRNSIHRFNLRQIEKNRFPVKCLYAAVVAACVWVSPKRLCDCHK
jgi:hypothetical protein